MLCKYAYLTTGQKEHGSFTCDTEDFKNFMKYRPRNVTSIIVSLQNGDVWIWTPKVKLNGRIAGGWEFVKNEKAKPVVEAEIVNKPLDFNGAIQYLFS